MPQVDTSRYTLTKLGDDPTTKFMQQDTEVGNAIIILILQWFISHISHFLSHLQALKKSIKNAQSQIMHRENELMNLEVHVETIPSIWLKHNQVLGTKMHI